MLDQCSDTCGWIAGIVAAISFGTFGVPIRSAKSKVKVDPLVMQSYKSLLCFLTCWLVIPLGEPFKFTPWGIVSGIFWVPGATAGIYGIQHAGLAVSVGTWSSIIVISSFCWGILVFHEGVKSKFHALLASLVLILGLVGMSVYSAPVDEKDALKKKGAQKIVTSPVFVEEKNKDEEVVGLLDSNSDRSNIEGSSGTACIVPNDSSETELNSGLDEENSSTPQDRKDVIPRSQSTTFAENDGTADVELIPLLIKSKNSSDSLQTGMNSSGQNTPIQGEKSPNRPAIVNRPTSGRGPTEFTGGKIIKRRKNAAEDKVSDEEEKTKKFKFDVDVKDEERVHFFGRFSLTKRQLGLLGAVINGVWGSNSMVPMHYARAQGFYGAGYLISYSVGSMIVTIILWFLRYCVNLYIHRGDFKKALNALPPFHFRILCGPGSMAGFLYSLGNFCSIIAVTALGQGVGYSFVQTSMLISGLWGIFYFGEVTGSKRIFKWIMSSLVTLVGILSLSFEHKGSAGHRLM